MVVTVITKNAIDNSGSQRIDSKSLWYALPVIAMNIDYNHKSQGDSQSQDCVNNFSRTLSLLGM